jgi:hypothetical protein
VNEDEELSGEVLRMNEQVQTMKVRFWLEPEPGSPSPSRVARGSVLASARGIGRVSLHFNDVHMPCKNSLIPVFLRKTDRIARKPRAIPNSRNKQTDRAGAKRGGLHREA